MSYLMIHKNYYGIVILQISVNDTFLIKYKIKNLLIQVYRKIDHRNRKIKFTLSNYLL